MTNTKDCSEKGITTLHEHYRYIAIIWSTDDVQKCRSDLDLDQAWHVLDALPAE